ncbi:22060_t:CDS:2 [Entrophospora sp. SA101]|nr:22060_t:CDS:2 [Entrophospora sp. SA101]
MSEYFVQYMIVNLLFENSKFPARKSTLPHLTDIVVVTRCFSALKLIHSKTITFDNTAIQPEKIQNVDQFYINLHCVKVEINKPSFSIIEV